MVPKYDLTVGTRTNDNLRAAMVQAEFSSAEWWDILSKRVGIAAPLTGLVRSRPRSVILLALPASYLHMVSNDLALVRGQAARRLRIFTSEAGRAAVPAQLRPCVLPYDDRLESLKGYAGTRADFPQRALKHFVETLQGHQRPLDQAHAAVQAALAELPRRTVPTRQKRSDDQIKAILKKMWSHHQGSSTRLLRHLRDEALIACEQSRFRTLWHQVRMNRLSSGRQRHVA
jgi:hypothetical protein